MIGGFAAFFLPLISLSVADSGGLGFNVLIGALVVVPITGFGLLFGKATRPWGIGLLIGWATAVIIVGGACVAIISSLSH
jgi:hypothetical protein